jgi:hypothetical protein
MYRLDKPFVIGFPMFHLIYEIIEMSCVIYLLLAIIYSCNARSCRHWSFGTSLGPKPIRLPLL